MAALNFPTSPSINDTYTANGATWLWDGASWVVQTEAVTLGGPLGTPSSGTLTNVTGLPISTGVSGLGTGVATALAVNVGSAGAPVVNGGALGTPSSGTLTNATGLPIVAGTTGTLTAARGGTGLTALGNGVATALGNATNGASGLVTLDASQNASIAGTLAMGSSFLRNRLINPFFAIWQRGTSITGSTSSSSASYWADRWCFYRTANPTAITMSYQSTGGPSGISSTFGRVQRTAGNATTEQVSINQTIEIANCTDLAGQTVTLSFYARCGANYSATSSALAAFVVTGTGSTDNNCLWNAWTGQTIAISQTATLTTSWQRFTYSGTVGGTVTQAGVSFSFTPTGTAGAADYIDITGVQLEVGSATAVERRSYSQELAFCQRYWQKLGGANVTDVAFGGYNVAGGGSYSTFALPVQMRTSPITTKVGTWNATNCGQPVIYNTSPTTVSFYAVVTASGAFLSSSNGTTTYLTNDAEL